MPRDPRRRPSVGVDLPNITGQVPYQVEQTIERLRDAIDGVTSLSRSLEARLNGMPTPLTLDQIRAGLAATGGVPLATAGLLNTNPPQTTPIPPPTNPPGSFVADGWAAITSDGVRVVFTALESGDPPTVQFASDTPIALPVHGMYPMAVPSGGSQIAIWKGSDNNAYTVTRAGTITLLGTAFGNYAVGLRTDATAVYQDSSSTYMVGAASNPIPAPFVGTENGFLALDGGGNPIWTDDQIANPIVIDGVRFNLASRNGDWTAGVATNGVQFLAYDHAAGEMYIAGPTSGSPIAPRPIQVSGGMTIATALPLGFLESANFLTYGTESPSAIDLTTVIWLQTDVSGWAQTGVLGSVVITDPPTKICTNYNKATGIGAWPVDGENAQGNPWVFAFINGRWYASTYEWYTQGQMCKTMPITDVALNCPEPIKSWLPVTGENVGWMVSGRARDGQRTVLERTNVIVQPWPL